MAKSAMEGGFIVPTPGPPTAVSQKLATYIKNPAPKHKRPRLLDILTLTIAKTLESEAHAIAGYV